MKPWFLLALLVSLWATTAHAQEARETEPSRRQVQLYTRARAAFDTERYDEAIRLLTDALRDGEINILLVSLGRAQFRAGDCAAADESWGRALRAPYVASPTRTEVRATVEGYRRDLQQCPGTLVIDCGPEDVVVRVDGEPRACSGAPIALPPGEHTIDARGETQRVTIAAMRRSELALAAPDAQVRFRDREPSLLPVIAIGAGAALLAAALVLDFAVLGPSIDEFEEQRKRGLLDARDTQESISLLQPITLVTYVVGVLAVGTGVTLFVLGGDDDDEEDVAVSVTPGGMRLRGSF